MIQREVEGNIVGLHELKTEAGVNYYVSNSSRSSKEPSYSKADFRNTIIREETADTTSLNKMNLFGGA